MGRSHVLLGFAIGLFAAFPAGPAADAPRVTRLALDEPEILLAPGGRTGVCDVLEFTPGGDRLFAAGEDKIVHHWAVSADGLAPRDPYYWNTFRERRGAIYAAAYHPGPKPLLAVGGHGKLDADVAVFDAEGKIVHALSAGFTGGYSSTAVTVWSLAFNPTGTELAVGDDRGNVWVWKVGGTATRVVAGIPSQDYAARVVWVGYLPDGRLAFARRDGKVSAVNPSGGTDVLFEWTTGSIRRVVASRDGRWLAALPTGETWAGSAVEVRSLPTGVTARTVPFPAGRYPDRAALSDDGSRLAVAVSEFGPRETWKPFATDPPGTVAVYDLGPATPRLVAEAIGPDTRPDRLAFHPDGARLATAGGDAHNTTLWKVAGGKLTRVADEVGQAQPLWAVRATADGRHLAFRTGRSANPPHPNDRGTGGWTAFDLNRRDWAAAPKNLVPPADALDGWTVAISPTDKFVWLAVGPDGKQQPLKLDVLRDDRPQCYTFLPADADDPAGSVKLAVGHYWGISVYLMTPGQPPRLDRKLAGHVGPVLSVAPALGGKALVSCGRDNVVAFWNLADFPSHPVLGAAFADEGGRLVVRSVDAGSPAEEAGLVGGDVLRAVAADEKWLPRGAWLDRLRDPAPGKELAFKLEREKVPGELMTKTSVLHRPVARFFPTRDGEWVLYTYRQCYYDCSTNGDRYVKWLVSKDKADQTPDVLTVDRFPMLRRPDKVADVIGRLVREPCKPILPDLFPPDVLAEVTQRSADDGATEVVAVVTPRPRQDGKVNPVERVEVWVNGHYRAGVESLVGRADAGEPRRVGFKLPADVFRAGSNEVRAVAVGRDAGVGVSRPVRVAGPPTARARRLYGVAVGINQYEYDSGPLRDLTCAVADARKFRDAWAGHFGGPDGKLSLLTDEAVTRAALLKAVAEARAAGPDDLFVLFLAGHGALGEHVGGADEWYYLIPRGGGGPLGRADWAKKSAALRDAFLRDDQLFDALAGLRCQTVVVLDCCHSGASGKARESVAATTRVRSLRPYGYGPVVIAACAPAQSSFEKDGQGFFTGRVVKALGREFGTADANRDRRLSAAELYEYVRAGVAKDVDGLEDENQQPVRQTPQIAPPVEDLTELILAEPAGK
jgi:WD40 repeat protein